MHYRQFGRTGLQVSEVGFGAWGIGGKAYGSVDDSEARDALAHAEELGCNFVDTAAVYGKSEEILGRFLKGRRDKWIIATKYSGQDAGLEETLDEQLKRLGVESLDLYMIHWRPPSGDRLYDSLARVRKSGKCRFVGVSLYTIRDIDHVLADDDLDFFEVPFSLLSPDPFMACLKGVGRKRPGVIVRSVLQEGFLAGKYGFDSRFPDPDDQRHLWTSERIAETVRRVEAFRFVESEAGSMVSGAVSYPLSFPEVSTVILGTKTLTQSTENFGQLAGRVLGFETLKRVEMVQRNLGFFHRKERITRCLRGLFR